MTFLRSEKEVFTSKSIETKPTKTNKIEAETTTSLPTKIDTLIDQGHTVKRTDFTKDLVEELKVEEEDDIEESDSDEEEGKELNEAEVQEKTMKFMTYQAQQMTSDERMSNLLKIYREVHDENQAP